MNEIRSVLVRIGLLARSGTIEGSEARPGDPSLNEIVPGDKERDLSEAVRSPVWLVLEILLVTILVFFWL